MRQVLSSIAKIDADVEEMIGNNKTYEYRSKITPHFDAPIEGKINAIGFSMLGRSKASFINVFIYGLS